MLDSTVGRVITNYIPTTNDELTLIQGDAVYVFKTTVPNKPGYWEGETNNVMGIFPSSHVKREEAASVGSALERGAFKLP